MILPCPDVVGGMGRGGQGHPSRIGQSGAVLDLPRPPRAKPSTQPLPSPLQRPRDLGLAKLSEVGAPRSSNRKPAR